VPTATTTFPTTGWRRPSRWRSSPRRVSAKSARAFRLQLQPSRFTNPEWEKTHAESVLGAARLHGYDLARFFDDRRDLDGAIASLVRAINASTADDPLYFIIAGPMEVPQRALQQADPRALPHVYCISHSNWNDGFAANYQFPFSPSAA